LRVLKVLGGTGGQQEIPQNPYVEAFKWLKARDCKEFHKEQRADIPCLVIDG